ncbi:hypothetical protein KFK14_07060 [Sphingobium phenoxybenzoativorans]|jgi:iron complex outermembrane receptor protein|uniref:TonB-dependent receptor n=1 Tax=Sphingobium phenoxybenzoativorans TaxID=1592790 RepID=A0A975Q367_9SPHN|nr:hypothetical protein [Sphingobium phenoxybenzoativorans]QUT07168.1 hypothetical protein KFK14_07060 [Sphingobium phenoxybenzoativorans]
MKQRVALVSTCSVITVMASSAAFAQTPQAVDSGLADIIVTAQKRSENVLKVPAAITAVTGEQLEARHVGSLEELRKIDPS